MQLNDIKKKLPTSKHELYLQANLSRSFESLDSIEKTNHTKITTLKKQDVQLISELKASKEKSRPITDISEIIGDPIEEFFSDIFTFQIPKTERPILVDSSFLNTRLIINHGCSLVTVSENPLQRLELEINTTDPVEHLHFIAPHSTQVDTTVVHLKQKTNYRRVSLSENNQSGIIRSNTYIKYHAKAASAENYHLSHLTGDKSHEDHFVFFHHQEEENQGEQLVKSLLENSSRFNFTGLIRIDQKAQLTDSKLRIKNTLLSSKARAFNRPWLEINADDVACQHGSSTGALNQEEFFYLTSRGISPAKANEMLLTGYTQEIIEKIENPLLKKLVKKS